MEASSATLESMDIVTGLNDADVLATYRHENTVVYQLLRPAIPFHPRIDP
jgi:hypothetical protein